MKPNRRRFLLGTAAVGFSAAGLGLYSSVIRGPNIKEAPKSKLAIPLLMDTKQNSKLEIKIQDGLHQFFPNIGSKTKGFNSNYLGPTLRMYKGETTEVTFVNELDDPTTIHGHGLHVDGRWDGGPQSVIKPKHQITNQYAIVQQASTNWYHPHLMGKTAEQVHSGLAGIIIIEDENSLALDLPKSYGIDDIPLIVQDRTFVKGVMSPYEVSAEQVMDGLKEETVVVNGTVAPFHNVPAGWVRLRLLNASNARYHRFKLNNGDSFFKIATEGGFLETPVKMNSLVMGPGERNEILVDMAAVKINTLLVEFAEGEDNVFTMLFKSSQIALELRATSTLDAHREVPSILNKIKYHNVSEVEVTREFVLQMGEGGHGGQMTAASSMMTINNQSMNMNVINHSGRTEQLELWRIRGQDMRHPFHMHGTSFLILSQNGSAPKPEDKGWKDTVDIDEGVTEVLLKFKVTASEQYPFMYHCHILEHEDAGMMGQFSVLRNS
jgi:bilirubin oxidase